MKRSKLYTPSPSDPMRFFGINEVGDPIYLGLHQNHFSAREVADTRQIKVILVLNEAEMHQLHTKIGVVLRK